MATYGELSRNAPAHPLVARSLEFCKNRSDALDIGAGSLRNSKYLLKEGFSVTAMDKDPVMQEVADELNDPHLSVYVSSYGYFDFAASAYDLVIAINSLPFESPERYPELFRKVRESLRPEGVLCATFFGPNDDWVASRPDMTFHSRAAIEDLCAGMRIHILEETEEQAKAMNGIPKHWHYFHLIAENA